MEITKKHLGKVIKNHRRRAKITQEVLSEGICTPSYLSRIENGHIEADKEIYQLLFKKLQLNYSTFIMEEQQLLEQLELAYEDILLNKSSSDALNQLYRSTQQSMDIQEIFLRGKIVYMRHLTQENWLDEAGQLFNELAPMEELFSERNLFLFYQSSLYYHLRINDYTKAFEFYTNSRKLPFSESQGSSYEIGSYYYNCSLLLCKIYDFYHSIESAQLAMHYFSKLHNPDYVFRCHILLGIAYNNLGQSITAKEHYEICLNILKYNPSVQSDEKYALIYTNLGYCFENTLEFEKAITIYQTALSYKNTTEYQLHIIRCLYQNNQVDEATMHLLQLDFDSLGKPFEKFEHRIFSLILNMDMPSSYDEIKNLESESLSYFQQNHQYFRLIFYSKIFASLYKKLNWYKKSNELNELVLHYFEKFRKGGITL